MAISDGKSQKVIVFHCPFPISNNELSSANLARPIKMLSAFQQLGYQVEEITGDARERRKKIKRLKVLVRKGLAIDFVYSESSNLPLFFSEPNRLPLYPFLEYRFFRWLRKKAIPHGLYLRDLHWRFPHFRNYPLYKRLPGYVFYWIDWLMYMSLCSHLFLPSLGLQAYLPTKPRRLHISALPPGCEEPRKSSASITVGSKGSNKGLTLFYVGGITPPLYDLTPLLESASLLPEESVVLCCRHNEWVKVKSAYTQHLSRNVRIVHAQGSELEGYYRSADLFLLAWKPYVYHNFAVPFKLFESVAYHLPIVTLEGSEASCLVNQKGFGWVAKNVSDLVTLISRLRYAPELIQEKRKQLVALAAKHSWMNRALYVAETLVKHSTKQQELSAP
jgi:hypothetical protein